MAWELVAGMVISMWIGSMRMMLAKPASTPPNEWPPLDPDAMIPRVTESAPIPVVFGTVVIANPNVVHIGAFAANAERQTSGEGDLVLSGAEMRRFRLDMTFAICAGPVDAVVRIDVDGLPLVGPADLDRVGAGPGFDLSLPTAQVEVADPNFFGDSFGWRPYHPDFDFGTDDGVAGRIACTRGGPTDTLTVADDLGYPTAELGELRGVLTATLRGLPSTSSSDFLRSGGAPFYHGTAPRLRPWRFVVERCQSRGFDDAQFYPATARITAGLANGGQVYDMNPAHIVHEILTDRAWGLGLPAADIDSTSFESAADLFAAQPIGMSMVWDRESTYADIIAEVERTTDSIVLYDERDGLWKIKPIREDYDPALLPTLDASNVVDVSAYTVPTTDDLPTTITVLWWSREEMRERSYTVHDQAAIAARGREITEVVRYPGIMSPGFVHSIAHRDLRAVSRPRATAEIVVQPSAAEDLRRGDPFRFAWSEWGVDTVLRVVSIDYGSAGESAVTIQCIEDVFVDGVEFIDEPGASTHENPVEDPVDVAPVVEEIPYWLWAREPSNADDLATWIADPGFANPDEGVWRNRAIAWALRPDDAGRPLWSHEGFRIAQRAYDTTTGGAVGIMERGLVGSFSPACVITTQIDRDATSSTGTATVTHTSPLWSPRVGDLIRVVGSSPTSSPTIVFDDAGPPVRKYDFSHLAAGAEEFLIVVEVIDDNNVRVLRGCLDTVVQETIATQTAYVVGRLPVSEYDAAAPWYSCDPSAWQGYGVAAPIRTGDPYDDYTEIDDDMYVDVRALSIARGRSLTWGAATANPLLLAKPEDTRAFPSWLSRAQRPLVPGSIEVVDDTVAGELRIEATGRTRLADWMVPASLDPADMVAAPPDATDWECDPDTYAEAWIYDGEVDPPELLEIITYDSAQGAFVWPNATEEAAYLAKNGTSQLFSDLWICVVTNNRDPAGVAGSPNKAVPSYQFARYHLERVILPTPIVQVDENSAKWQDVAGTIAATTHADPVARWDNAGSLGSYFEWYGGSGGTLDTATMAATSVAFAGGLLQFAIDDPQLTIVSGQGFEVFVALNSTSGATNRGPVGKWDIGTEWVMCLREFVSPYAVLFGPDSQYARGKASHQVNDGVDHVIHGRVNTSDQSYVGIDGVDVAGPVTMSTVPADSADRVTIGGYSTNAVTRMTGSIRGVRIYPAGLTNAQRVAVVAQMNS